MSSPVDRTCTEVRSTGGSGDAAPARRLADFRDHPAYVLLGDPGAGKTTEFGEESGALGTAAALMVSARDFVTFDPESHPEWRNRTLFIDGLDETRTGGGDVRAPLDAIRNRLDRLGRPNFRISCRSADWLGPNDLQALTVVAPDSRLTVLRLDPLSPSAVRELLGSRQEQRDLSAFLDNAQRWGVYPLLSNPLTLNLLADSVGQSGDWPDSRLQIFEMACQYMAGEYNPEHEAGGAGQPTETVMDAAGHLCALLLLAGIEGFTLRTGEQEDSFAQLGFLEDHAGHPSSEWCRAALGTRLFTANDKGFTPLHRHVAEFLASRYLAGRIRDGLPAQRVVGLMVGPGDGRVVTALRGVSAWLAAHASEARRLLIDADPTGVALYGDIQGFTTDDKERLLRAWGALAPLEQVRYPGRPNDVHGASWVDTASALRHLATADMVGPIETLLEGRRADGADDQLVWLVLTALSEAGPSEIESLSRLAPDLKAVVGDASQWAPLGLSALNAYRHIGPPGDARTKTFRELLEALHRDTPADPDGELRGTLLADLYPTEVPPSQVWRYALGHHQQNFIGRFWRFWDRYLLERSSDTQVAELLDALCEDAERLIPALEALTSTNLPLKLLARGLPGVGETPEPSRVCRWLGCIKPRRLSCPTDEAAQSVRAWLQDHPQVQKSMFLAALRQGITGEWDRHRQWWEFGLLDAGTLPCDFGLWCLEQAVETADTEPALSRELLNHSLSSLKAGSLSEGLTLTAMRERTHGKEALERELDELSRECSESQDPAREPYRRRVEELRAELHEEERQRRLEWSERVRSHEIELRENRLSPPNLHTLAMAALGLFSDSDRNASPRRRIAEFIGGDKTLVDAVMAGLRGALWRGDVPDVERTISLSSESMHPWLAYPVLASLQLSEEEDPARLDTLADARRREALAIYYCVPSGRDEPPGWHKRWIRENPELVLDVIHRCAVARIRHGQDLWPVLNDLTLFADHDDLVQDVRLRLLRAFPTRGPQLQLSSLDWLLAAVLQHPDKTALKGLAEQKVSLTSMTNGQRVRWLAVDALTSRSPGLPKLRSYVGNAERRAGHLAGFMRVLLDNSDTGSSTLTTSWEPATLRAVIEMLGPFFAPWDSDGAGWVTLEMDTSWMIAGLIRRLGSLPDDEAQQALADLLADDRLAAWRGHLADARNRQRVVGRDASYRHPDLQQVQRTLGNGAPANAADLAALLADHLTQVAADLRGGNDNFWRQFWNENQHGHPNGAKHENSCRDALLGTLRERLRDEVDLAPEGRYAAGGRADIRANCPGFNVPIEIKKNSHRELWRAPQSQLIDRYTTDPATDGYGIYLVLWFGENGRSTIGAPDGKRPSTPEELQQRLAAQLSAEAARKISVIVLDVTKPGDRPTGHM